METNQQPKTLSAFLAGNSEGEWTSSSVLELLGPSTLTRPAGSQGPADGTAE